MRTEHADAARDALVQVLASVPLPLVVSDATTGTIVHANDAYLELIERDRETVIGATGTSLAILEDPTIRDGLIAELRTNDTLVDRRLAIKTPRGATKHVSISVRRFDFDGRPCFLTTMLDITEKRATIARLEESEQRFRAAFDAAATGMALVAPDGRWLRVNRSVCQMLGYDAETLLAMTFQMVTHPDDVDIDLSQVRRMLAGEIDYFELEKRYRHALGHIVWARLSVALVRDDAGAPLYFVSQMQDVSEAKRVEDALRASETLARAELRARLESERRFRAIFDHTFQFTGLLAPDGSVLETNATALAFAGLTRDQVIGKLLWEAPWWRAETTPRIRDAVGRAAAGEFVRFEVEVLGAGDTTMVIDFSLKPLLDELGRVAMLIPEGRDVTDIKRAERRLEASLEEKEILLKEIHHRVKNNMQVVSSLLQLQSRYTKDPEATAMFRESQDRIRSMALIHEKLYKTKDLSRVDFADYLHTLGEMMSRSYGGTRAGVRIVVEASPAHLGVDTAIPVGLILNELVTNAMKHAFTESMSGSVTIRFSGEGERRYQLVLEDDGIGLPSTFSLEADTTLGLRLLRILTEQVDGTLTFTPKARGSSFRLGFTDASRETSSPR